MKNKSKYNDEYDEYVEEDYFDRIQRYNYEDESYKKHCYEEDHPNLEQYSHKDEEDDYFKEKTTFAGTIANLITYNGAGGRLSRGCDELCRCRMCGSDRSAASTAFFLLVAKYLIFFVLVAELLIWLFDGRAHLQ